MEHDTGFSIITFLFLVPFLVGCCVDADGCMYGLAALSEYGSCPVPSLCVDNDCVSMFLRCC